MIKCEECHNGYFDDGEWHCMLSAEDFALCPNIEIEEER
jgi:hypothetical protein